MFRTMAVLLVALTPAIPVRAQGILDRARQEAEGGASSPSTKKADKNDSSGSKSDSPWNLGNGNEEFEEFLGSIGFGAFFAPFWLPPFLLHDDFNQRGQFPGHPYALPTSGYIDQGTFLLRSDVSRSGPDLPTAGHAARGQTTPEGENLDFFDPQRLKSWSTRAAVEAGHDFANLARVGGRFALDTEWRIGLTSAWDYDRERLPCGCIDETVIGDLNLTVRFAQAEWVQMYAGLGARGMFDYNHTRAGVNFQYGADFFPVDPVVVSTLFEMGNLREAFVTRLRATIGVQMQHVELFAGYDWLRIGGVDLHGPMAGVRLWF